MSNIVSLQAENVKRLRAVEITPDGNLVVIGGDNEQGKSSVLDSIAMALGGGKEVPQQPIRQGESKAKIVLDLGDMTVRRTFTAAGGSALSIEMKDGSKCSSPQTILDGLTNKVTFDPIAFIHCEAVKQSEILRKLVGLDFTEANAKRAALYNERTSVNREVEQLRAAVAQMPHHKDAPVAEESVAAVVSEVQRAQESNRTLEIWVEDAKRADAAVATWADKIKKLNDEIAALQSKLTDAAKEKRSSEEHLAKTKAQAESRKPVDLAPLQAKLAGLEAANAKVRDNLARDKKIADGKEKKARADQLTKEIDAIDSDREKQLKAAKYPVDGLSFTESGIFFNGVPFDQASSAQKLRVSVAIAAAQNPKLRVMLVRDGSLLDPKSLTLLGELAKEYNLQVWVERVSKGAECSVIIEDGAIAQP